MKIDLSLDESRVELGFNCADDAQAEALFERLQTMLETGLIVLQLSTDSGAPITLEQAS